MSRTNGTLLIHERHALESRRVLMKWVIVTDRNGNLRPQMDWQAN